GDLNQQESHPAGRRVQECRFAFFQWISAVGQIMGGHPLEHKSGGWPRVYVGGYRYKSSCGYDGVFSVRSRNRRVADTFPFFHFCDIGSDGVDDPRPFRSQGEGCLQRIETGALIDVDVIDADRFDFDTGLTGFRFGNRDLFEGQNFRTAIFMNSHCFHTLSSFEAPGYDAMEPEPRLEIFCAPEFNPSASTAGSREDDDFNRRR